MFGALIFARSETGGQLTTKHIFDHVLQVKAASDDQNQVAKLKFYFVLLTDATATNQQLRITSNNFRLPVCDECCVLLLAVLSTTCSVAARGRSAGVVGEEKEKN